VTCCAPPSLHHWLQTKLLAAEKEREATINSSKQFVMIKQLLTRKNAQLAELRARIRKCVMPRAYLLLP